MELSLDLHTACVPGIASGLRTRDGSYSNEQHLHEGVQRHVGPQLRHAAADVLQHLMLQGREVSHTKCTLWNTDTF